MTDDRSRRKPWQFGLRKLFVVLTYAAVTAASFPLFETLSLMIACGLGVAVIGANLSLRLEPDKSLESAIGGGAAGWLLGNTIFWLALGVLAFVEDVHWPPREPDYEFTLIFGGAFCYSFPSIVLGALTGWFVWLARRRAAD